MNIVTTRLLTALSFILVVFTTSSHAENDINAQDLSRDLKDQSKQLTAPSLPTPVTTESSEQELPPESTPPWFKVELIVFKQHLNSVNEVFPSTIDYTPAEPIIQLNDYDYKDEHKIHAEKHDWSYLNPTSTESSVATQTNQVTHQEANQETSTAETIAPYTQEELLLLIDAQKRLIKSKNYDILLATSWKQPTVPKEQAPTLHITAGNWFDDQPELELFITVSKQRYLHAYVDAFLNTYNLKSEQSLDLDLTGHALTQPTDNENQDSPSEQDNTLSNQGIQPHHFKLFALNIDEQLLGTENTKASSYVTDEVFYIHEDRIMKHSKDLYFLDHPKFGVIIKLTPLEKALELESELKDKAAE